MSNSVYLFGGAFVAIILITIVPKMMNVRIWVLEKLHLNWFAKMHKKYYDGIVIAVRVIIAAIAGILIWLGFQSL